MKNHWIDMQQEEILSEFRNCQALLEGHFILSSGRHSGLYLQCARMLMNPERASQMAVAIAANLPRNIRSAIELVVSPAMGGLIVGHEVARALGVDAIFLERPEGVFELRRGFSIQPGQKILLVEDVITTGLSAREAIEAIREEGGEVIAATALVDRLAGSADLGVPFHPLVALNFPSYAPDEVPDELNAIPAEKPGSRRQPGHQHSRQPVSG